MASINVISKTVADSATPEALGAETQRFNRIVFYGGKGTAETRNTGTVYVQLRSLHSGGGDGDFTSSFPVPSGGYSVALNRNNGLYSADQFKIKVESDGDGVIAIIG